MRTRLTLLIVSLSLGACAESPRHEQRWHGDIAGCGGPSTLTRIDETVAFAPGDGALVLHGTVAADGRFTATLNTQPAGKPPFVLTVSGHLDAETVQGSYATPRCHADFTLARVHPALL